MPNLKKIDKVTVGAGGTSSITFSNIPQTYTDLVIKVSGKADRSGYEGVGMLLSFNGSTSTFSSRVLYGTGASTGGFTLAQYAGDANGPTATENTFASTDLYIPNYTSSNNKSYSSDSVTENNASSAYTYLIAGLWETGSAITSITLTPAGPSNFVQYSSATLYGISSVTTGSKATGGIVSYDSTYYYHTFPYSGTFTPTQSLTADVLIVAGGGGGGNNYGGGGGGGGLIYASSSSLTAQAYTVTVGAGGAVNVSGSNTVFNSQTAVGGGRGGDNNNSQPGGNGGSGGGGASSNTSAYRVGGTGTAGQGYDGGTGTGLGSFGTGGGGGAGGIGGNGSGGGTGGAAGAGLQYFGTYYSNGGMGMGSPTPGSAGTGGTAANTTPTANTGKGGPFEKAGASGVVIVRYAI